MLDGKLLTKNATYDLPITGSGLHFSIIKLPKGKKVKIVIQSAVAPAFRLELDTAFFNSTTTFFTDKNSVMQLKNQRLSLKKDFSISVGCPDVPDETVICNFHPVKANVPVIGGFVNQSLPNVTFLKDNPTDNTENIQQASKEYHPGSAVIDALYLSKDPAAISLSNFNKILKLYFDTSFNDADVIASINANKFLKGVFDEKYIQNLQHDSVALTSGGGIFSSLSLSSISGLDVTTIADGLAKFVVKRAREELSMAFFGKFKEKIDSCKDLQVLFPQTSILLDAIDQQIYDYNRYLQNLRESFKEDIIAIHRNLPGIIDNHQDFFNRHPELEVTLRSSCYIAGGLEEQVHPGDILENYPVDYLDKDSFHLKNLKGAIQTLQLLSSSLRDTTTGDDSNYWVNIKQIRDLVNNKLAFRIYLGLIYQRAQDKADGIKFQHASLTGILDLVEPKFDDLYDSYKRYVLGFGEKVNLLNKMVKEYSKRPTDSAALELYAKYFKASVDMIEYCTAIADLPKFKDTATHIGNLHKTLKPYFDITYAVSDMVMDANRRSYSAVINHAIQIYNIVVTKRHQEDFIKLQQKLSSDKSLKTSFAQIQKSADTSLTNLNALVRYGGFMAAVATAKTSDDVAAAVETFALPVGSSRIKRVSNFNVALNAYVGLYAGVERIRGYDNGKWKLNTTGLTAPIGVSASWGRRLFWIPTGKSEWSTSIFVSLIDIGAVAAFRFNNDTTIIKTGGQSTDSSTVPAQVPTIQLKNILSPGIFLSVGIPKTPLSVNFGVQTGPNLRKISLNENGQTINTTLDENKLYVRYSISVCVDIPIFNLFTKAK